MNVSDGAIEEVAEGAILGTSISPDRSSILVVKGIEHLPPPKTDPLPAPLRLARAPDSTPFVRWEVSLLSHRNGAWRTVGASATGTGAVTSETLPRWQPDGRAWAMLQEPNPFALEPTTEVFRFDRRNRWVSKNSFGSHREGREALAAVERGKGSAEEAARPKAVPVALAARIGADARFIGETRSKSQIFQSHANHGAVLWAINGDHAIELAKVNEHLRDVAPPQPLPVRYSANGGERTGWLHLPPGVEGPVPVVVTAYPLTVGLPPQFALPPEGTFPVLYELLARGVAVYVSDLRIQMPDPSIDEPVQRILSEMEASIEALKATGKVQGDKIAFFGHSFGGYTAVTLLAHTSYLRGIVAAAPLGDLFSYAFSTQRYHFDEGCAPAQVLNRQMAHEYPGGAELPPVNNLLMKMGGPPYALRDKYLRNSPLLNMKDAVTPALIIQGSEDGFADGERIFNTLYRLGVKAELLYYWGEGHIVYSPANVRDMTERTIEWLIAHLNGPAQEPSAAQ